jgi:hypothetical protein
MRWRHIDLQVFLEVGHVFPNVSGLGLARYTPAPSAAVDCPEHDVFTPSAEPCNQMLQFRLMDDEGLTEQAQAAALVQKNKSWPVGMVDVDH